MCIYWCAYVCHDALIPGLMIQTGCPRYTVTAKLFAIFPLNCTKAGSSPGAIWRIAIASERNAEVNENLSFHVTQRGIFCQRSAYL